MTRKWEPCEQYNYGDIVVFDDVEYKVIQPHRSQGDWTPPYTPALWGRMQGGHHHRKHSGEQFEGDSYGQQQQRQQYDQEAPAEEKEKHWYDMDDKRKKELEIAGGVLATAAIGAGGYYAYKSHENKEEGVQQRQQGEATEEKHWYDMDDKRKKELEIAGGVLATAAVGAGGYYAYKSHESKKEEEGRDYKSPAEPPSYGQQQQRQQGEATEEKHWYDVDDKRKKELEIGGGLLVGAAAIGAGYLAYKSHENKKEEDRAHAWSSSNWIKESQARTQQWHARQSNAKVAWIWNEGKTIPRDAIQGGEEDGKSLYICRAYHEGGLLVGKASKVFKEGAVIGYKKDEIHLSKYEILVGESSAVKWVSCSGQLNLDALRAQPVEGGREPDGAAIYIAQAPYNNAVHPGKASEVYGDGCFIPYDDTEKKVKEYAVLCYA